MADPVARSVSARAAREPVVVSGLAVRSAAGSGADLLARACAGSPAFEAVTRFDAAGRRTRVAATLPGDPALADELAAVIDTACADASLSLDLRTDTPLLLAAHADRDNRATAAEIARRTGLPTPSRIYTAACVAATSAVADAATMITAGQAERVVVAAGYLVEPGTFALFDAGRTLARDGRVRPFSAGRQGMVLGDALAAVVVESARAAENRGVPALARLAGWGRTGDAYHVCQPRPDGTGLARAIETALQQASVAPAEIGYVNANGTGTVFSDCAESAALHLAFGTAVSEIPVSSTKSVHGHALEASGLMELALTVLVLRAGRLPVNAGFLEPDEACRLDLVLGEARATDARYAVTVNAAFGGANTALLVGAP
jgi:3-oxoacyl-[acyl-carrier-protein] synthase II